jgi:pimeloyl-ACP methyl ester carboxylesterase
MKQTEIIIPDDYVSALNINGLHGRTLSIPSKNKRQQKEILVIYGHHSSLERMYSFATHFSSYGNVTMPDLPGFGGMDSFYTIHKQPTLDVMADYLATFIKLQYKKEKFVLCGMSYGFLVATRMLQKYPDIASQVSILISLVGFSSGEDFSFSKRTHSTLTFASKVLSIAPLASLVKHVFITKPVITATYTLMAKRHAKMKDADTEERNRRIRFEVYLWKCNDVRTYFSTSHEFLTCDLTDLTVPITLQHVTVDADQYFDEKIVNKNLNKIFASVKAYKAKLPNHAPTVVSDENEAAAMLPAALKKLLRNAK